MSGVIVSLRILFMRRMLWVLLPTLAIGGALSYWYAAKNILESYDLNLLDDATDLVHQVQILAGGRLLLELPSAARQMLSANNDDDVIYAVWDSQQRMLLGTNELHLAMNKETFTERYSFKNLDMKGQRYRVIILQARLDNHPYFVSVAQTTHAVDHLLNNLLIGFLLFGGLLIIVAYLGIVLGVKRSLVPIEALRTAIANRAPQNFHPISETHAPSELQPIIYGVNELLLNLEKSVLNHRRFVADAAHQLRTPLAILRSKLEVGLSNLQQDKSQLLQELLTTTERASHLTSQLLSLARIENYGVIAPELKIVHLPTLLRNSSAHFIVPAENKHMELEFELCDCQIQGDALLLQELVANLLENAINYAGLHTTLKVILQKNSQGIELIISDNGVGVPDEVLNKLGQPFFRYQSQNTHGCGLGLAIAKEIVSLHNGKITFGKNIDSHGLYVTISLPN